MRIFPVRKRLLWVAAALLASVLDVVALRLVRDQAAAERARADAVLRAPIAEYEAFRALKAEREATERLRKKFEDVSERHDRTWLCERVRCNEADRAPIWDTEPAKLERDPFDDWAEEPRRRR